MYIMTLYRIALLAVITVCAVTMSSLAFAQDDASVDVSASTTVQGAARIRAEAQAKVEAREQARTTRVSEVKARAKAELDRRINALTKLAGRLEGAKRVSADVKTQLVADTNALMTSLSTLDAKIQSETSTSTLRSDVASITGSYRVYLLVIPKGHLLAAADGVKTAADLLVTANTKLASGIAKAKASGNDVSNLETWSADLVAKTNDAKAQADAATAILKPLVPDEKNNVTLEANKKALMDARAKIKTGTDDLKAARDDARKILAALKQMRVYTSVGASASSTTNAQ